MIVVMALCKNCGEFITNDKHEQELMHVGTNSKYCDPRATKLNYAVAELTNDAKERFRKSSHLYS